MSKNQGKINILGINVGNFNLAEIKLGIKTALSGNKYSYAVTPNPEIILGALKDEELFYILNRADFAPADGIGLKGAGLVLGKNLQRITGVDLSVEILNLAAQENKKVLMVNWSKGLSSKDKITKILSKKYPRLNFLVVDTGRRREKWKAEINGKLKDFKPEIVFCAFGSPYQEKFIYHIKNLLPSLKFGIGVGGTFDFISGSVKRAPKTIRTFGLEWLWRLAHQPKRAKRIYNATIMFPYKFFLWRFIQPFLYRPSVVCLLYKKTGNKTYVLIVEREDDPGHWQIPQGGLDNEDITSAGTRELREEIGTGKFKPVKSVENVFRYEFNAKSKTRGSMENSGSFTGYKGQKQSLFIAEFFGQDRDIKINFWDHAGWKWIEIEKILQKIHSCRREGMKKFLSELNLS